MVWGAKQIKGPAQQTEAELEHEKLEGQHKSNQRSRQKRTSQGTRKRSMSFYRHFNKKISKSREEIEMRSKRYRFWGNNCMLKSGTS